MTDPSKPGVYTPGAKAERQPADVACVQWNRKVQHILATTSSTGVTVVWDLKAKRPIINFSDKSVPGRCRSMAWHPENATQIVTGAENDDRPVVQLWDLRNTYAPVRYLEAHTRGVASLSWSAMDPALLVSSGIDGRTICWNVDTGRVLCELDADDGATPSAHAGVGDALNGHATGGNAVAASMGAHGMGMAIGGGDAPRSARWNFNVSWSPRLTSIFATSAFDGTLAVHSVVDTAERSAAQRQHAELGAIATTSSRTPPDYTRAPRWLRRSAGVAFAFGGRLVSFVMPPTQPAAAAAAAAAAAVPGGATTAPNAAQQIQRVSIRTVCEIYWRNRLIVV